MELAAVMDEVAEHLRTIPQFEGWPKLTVFEYPPASIGDPPAAVVTYPLDIAFDGAYGRGTDSMNLPVVLMVGKPAEKTGRDHLAAYCNGGGPYSVKAAVESGAYTSCHVVRVTGIDFDPVSMGGLELLAATFNLQIVGQGAP